MGSEMCIRDSHTGDETMRSNRLFAMLALLLVAALLASACAAPVTCLLYTSDAADERSSVDLGGRRIIKKKNKCEHYRAQM